MALNRSDKSRILRRYFPGMTRNSEMSTEPNTTVVSSPKTAVQNGRATTSIPRRTAVDIRRPRAVPPGGGMGVRRPVQYRAEISTPGIVAFTLIVHAPASRDLRLPTSP